MAKILIADDDPRDRNQLGTFLTGQGYEVEYAESGSQALKLASQSVPDLILLDVVMPDMDGLEVCRHLRLDPLLSEVPIILITQLENRESCFIGLVAGADDVLTKPLDMRELRSRVKNIVQLNRYRKLVDERAIHEQARVERETAYDATLEGWARALELRGLEPEGHIQRVTRMSLRLARARHVPEKDLVSIRRGALLHDSGKAGVSNEIFTKGRPLSEKDRAALRKHPETAYNLFCCIDVLQTAIDIPFCHHERWDGTGYPRGLKGQAIPLAARIFAVADAWDILTAPPPCGKGWSRPFARQQILAQAGKRFDPDVVRTFDAQLTPEDMAESGTQTITDAEALRAAQADSRPSCRVSRLSLATRGAKLHFVIALTLISVIPVLAFLYIIVQGFIASRIGWGLLMPMATAVLLLMSLGYGILAKYPVSITRMRHWVEGLAKGEMPVRIELSSDESDLAAIEHCLHEVVRQSQQRIHRSEQQTEALLIAERQRVAIEGLGAACHHLGQPATSIAIALHMMRRANIPPEVAPLIDQCQEAADAMADILQKLQHIASYRTEPYLVSTPGAPTGDNKNILKL